MTTENAKLASSLEHQPGPKKMRAVVQSEYGSPDVLRLEEVDRPLVGSGDVLVRVQAAAVHAGDWHLMRGEPFLIRFIFGGILKPKIKILGCDVAGRVEAVGQDVSRFQVGDEVFGDMSVCGFGAFAEYVCAPESALVPKPAAATFTEAAAVPCSALAALQALRDVGQIQPGQQVLINGASGGVGSFAVQIAKALGAIVTGVCSTGKLEMVRSLGADQVIDYTQTDFAQARSAYDLIVDTAAYRPVFDLLPALTPEGTYVMVGGSTARFFQAMFLAPWISRTSRRQVRVLESKPNPADLTVLKDMMEAGQLAPFIDRCYSLGEVPDAIRHIEQRQVQGKVVISI